ncbi:cytochrome c biogenesis protein ResB [Rubritalea marina]|uniref:cytochrome c biogenesis protein ResB n=1 Tax=Rubritalea marina TaxID=361055 RepID=UPI00035C0ED6|nr:cytochrome c biogenesis protein ResB [Rubritalea marina]
MAKKNKNVATRVIDVLGGFHVAIVSMVLLLILTWLSTLEQTGPGGLYWTLKKYFSFDAWYVVPTLNGKDLPIILPGGYWVCVVFTLNLIFGGVIRMRKGIKQLPIFFSHVSMAMLMIGGAITYHQSREAYMVLPVGASGDFAFSLTELSVEVAEIDGYDKKRPYVIDSKQLEAVRGQVGATQEYLFPELPFDIRVSDYYINAKLYPMQGSAPEGAVAVDGYYAMAAEPTGHEEQNLSSCVVRVIERESGKQHEVMLYEGVGHDVTVTIDGKVYGFRMHGEVWNTPFQVRLDDSRGEKHPGTGMAMIYESDVTVLDSDGNAERSFKIEMNKPLRYKDLTFYQTSWEEKDGLVESGFTVKTNPSDQWPKYSIYACGIALFVHFIIKLFGFVSSSIARNKHD